MPETVKKIASLILKYWRQELEEDELNELLDWANHTPANREVFVRLTNPDFIVDRLRELTLVKQQMRQRVWTELQLSDTEMRESEEITEENKRQYSLLNLAWWKWTMSAMLLVMAGILIVWLSRSSPNNLVNMADTGITEIKLETEPQQSRSQLRFADGRLLYPDTMQYGAVLEHGNLQLIKEPGGIRVNTIDTDQALESSSFTTITTAVGERLTLWLPDGTEVKMNTASLLRFPVMFGVKKRTVEASGELYFTVTQVSGGWQTPFVVHTSGMNMETRSARFNVHVYPNDKLAAATLETGNLLVWKQVVHTGSGMNGKDRVDLILKPGRQAQISNSTDGKDMGGIRVELVDLHEILSWKNEQQ